jgi:hypothetical protein
MMVSYFYKNLVLHYVNCEKTITIRLSEFY